MNVEVFINNKCVLTALVREEEANEVAGKFYRDYKIGLLQMMDVPASVVITGVRSKVNGPEINEVLNTSFS